MPNCTFSTDKNKHYLDHDTLNSKLSALYSLLNEFIIGSFVIR